MSRCLLQISIGPIQNFIAAARRTRDLWFGSFLLSEISKASARAIAGSGGKLIFPNPLKSSDLDLNSDFNVANVILAEFEDEKSAPVASASANEAAVSRWRQFVDEAYGIMMDIVDKEAWSRQRDQNDVIEFYSAWYPFENDDDYKTARRDVARLLAARKSLRDFEPNFKPGEKIAFGIRKSSLDGRRESVLLKDQPKSGQNRGGDINAGGVWIKAGESLDIVGCVKRSGGGFESFPSIARIALDPWIRGFRSNEGTCHLLDALCDKCGVLWERRALSKIDEKMLSYDAFPYEGPALMPQRYDDFKERFSDAEPGSSLSIIKDTVEEMRTITRQLSPRPLEPYVAVLFADGDKIGRTISKLDSPEEHRKFSKALSKFAESAGEIIRESYGRCVYAGGDDVLAFLPLDTALGCARKLHDSFGGLWTSEWGSMKMPSLSVGIAVGHALEDLEDLLLFGREAEKTAKKHSEGKTDEDDRDGLAITIRARGNSEISVRERWKGARSGPETAELADLSLDERLLFWADCFENSEIPSKFPYELRGAAKFYDGWESGDTLDEAMRTDVKRIFRRKDLNLEEKKRSLVEEYIKKAVGGSYRSIERLAGELVVAQWIGEARARAGGKFQ
jgi:CRISPR-associated protein Cmr2